MLATQEDFATVEREVPLASLPWLETQWLKLVKKAARLGVESPTYSVLGPGGDPETRYVRFSATMPVLSGWHLVATIEWAPLTHEAISRVVPGETIPEHLRQADSHCDHCQQNRRRKSVVILRHDDGRVVQVGRACVRDYLGTANVGNLLFAGEFWSQVEGLTHGSYQKANWTSYYPLQSFLVFVAQSIRQRGWVSRKVQELSPDGDLELTAEAAYRAMTYFLYPDHLLYDRLAEHAPSEGDIELAQKALNWAAAISATEPNDFLRNCGVIARAGVHDHRSANTAAAIIIAYERAQKALEPKPVYPESQYVGQVGERFEGEVKVLGYTSFDSEWGTRWCVRLVDTDGNRLVWWASGGSKALDDLPEDRSEKTVRIKGTVKKHEEYREKKQTVLSRVSVI